MLTSRSLLSRRDLRAKPILLRPKLRRELGAEILVLEHLSEPELTPQRIAKENHISLRYLHLLFVDAGITVSAWIRSQRLERCAADLANPALAEQSITQIAHRWGFNDLGHFGKLLHRKFGASPRDYRRQHLQTAR